MDGKNGSKESIIYLGCHCEPKMCTNLFSLILCMTGGGCFGNGRALEHQNSIFPSPSPSFLFLFLQQLHETYAKRAKKTQRRISVVFVFLLCYLNMKYASSFECVLERRRASATPLWAVNAHMTIYFCRNKIWFGDMTIFSGVRPHQKPLCVYHSNGRAQWIEKQWYKKIENQKQWNMHTKKKDANFRFKSEKKVTVLNCVLRTAFGGNEWLW